MHRRAEGALLTTTGSGLNERLIRSLTVQEQLDRAYRGAYRLAYPIMRRWWRLIKRRHVVVAIWLNDTVLAVRHSYKNPGLSLVYGGVGRREDPRLAGARELQEEVGVTIDRDALRLVMVTPTMHLYEGRVAEKPELVIDRREIVEACFVHPGELIEIRYRNKVSEYLRRHRAGGTDVNGI